jgi:hypothetical protein
MRDGGWRVKIDVKDEVGVGVEKVTLGNLRTN